MPSATAGVVVQVIRVHWTKRSRGGPGATRRASAPRAAALADDGVALGAGLLVDELTLSEPDFQPVRATARYPDPADLPVGDGVRLHRAGDQLAVRFEYPPGGGAPARWMLDAAGTRLPLAADCFALDAGQWGRVEWNARTSSVSSGEWSYRHTTVNIAFGTSGARAVFLASPPEAAYSQLAVLR